MFGKTGAILLSIANLPPQISRKDLKKHVQSVIAGLDEGGFRFPPAIGTCNILRITNTTSGVVSHQGLVSIQPARLALRLMSALEQKPLRGLNLQVSRYRHGSFPVNSSTPLVSMTDLLRVNDAVPGGRAWKLDLVSDTGLHKVACAPTPRHEADGLLAH
ncbi:MAG: hypothetical protein PVJ30_02715 [Thiohalocapsa sp.]|jgi:hypothetical protein|uniref:hypothetical protein n=1 Tax=Thiohalocapsa sp. TaxID=2497641 RepID=UPI0025D9D92E|nr:hypothetical protein [Thiohalocapsa sp.]